MSNFFKEWKAQRAAQEFKIDLGSYYKFDGPTDPKNIHYFLAEELLTPCVANTDTQRENMFASHLTQTVHLVSPEYPKVFTNFENQVGEYSISYRKAKEDFRIIAKLQKNALNYDLIIQYLNSKVYDVVHIRSACHITEAYGYGIKDCVGDKKVGDVVRQGDFIYKAPNYDDAGNFGYGTNLKVAYNAWKGKTYEDAVVISESAAKKLTSYKVQEIFVSVNGNDILLNIYDNGEYNQYHSFPHVGEYTRGDVLVASRREDKNNILYSFQYDKIKTIEPTDDVTYAKGGGMVADLDIYCNASLDFLKKSNNEFTQELVGVLEEQNKYYENAKVELEKILPIATLDELMQTMSDNEKEQLEAEKKEYGYNWERPKPKALLGIEYTDEFGYFWKQVHEYLDTRIKWRSKGSNFQNFKIKFTILKENPLEIGCKVTGRYGNKGVISLIEPDENMPHTEDGVRADIVLNILGVINRMNPSQLIEQHINFMSDHVLKEMEKIDNASDQIDYLMTYIKYLDKDQYDFFESEVIMYSRSQKEDLLEEIKRDGIFIHQTPFFKKTSMETFKRIAREHPEWVTRYKCVGIERPLVIGDEYFIRLIFSRLALIDGEFLRALFTKYIQECVYGK